MNAEAANSLGPPSASRTTAMMAHLSTLVGFFVSVPVALGLVGPALAWLMASQRGDAFVHQQAREALNFHMSVLVVGVLVIALPTPATLVAVLVVIWLALVIGVAGLAYEGRSVRYPVALPIVRARRGEVSRG